MKNLFNNLMDFNKLLTFILFISLPLSLFIYVYKPFYTINDNELKQLNLYVKWKKENPKQFSQLKESGLIVKTQEEMNNSIKNSSVDLFLANASNSKKLENNKTSYSKSDLVYFEDLIIKDNKQRSRNSTMFNVFGSIFVLSILAMYFKNKK